jgi:ribonuclease R
MPISAPDLLRILQSHARQPLTAGEIFAELSLSPGEQKLAIRFLDDLVRQGALVSLKGERYSIPSQVSLVVGVLRAHRDGYGFVSPRPGEGADVFVPARYLREVMDGDRVIARVERGGRGGKPEGRIIRVLERAHQTMVGRYEVGRRIGFVVAADPRIAQDLFIPPGAEGEARPGQVVVARIDNYPSKTRGPEGTIIEVLGEADDPAVEILAIVHKNGLPHKFPPEVLAAAEAVPHEVGAAEIGNRVDLRTLPIVTIDGETARDFDDAVAVRQEEGGRIRLWVSIADVGHYVAESSLIDVEAYERGTSVYFPGQCIPMLPEALSNGICSLNPGVDRLTMTAEMVFDEQGKQVESRFYPSVIKSHARLTYTEVRDMLTTGEGEGAHFPGLLGHLRLMEELAGRLTAMRRRRGSLDFDLPEAEVVLDLQGRPENIIRSERNVAHRLIEECMLAANEAVAAYLTANDVPLLYRIHEPPDLGKMQAFQEFISHFNYGLVLDGVVEAKRLQTLLAEVAGQPEERMINQTLLKSMKQARYAPDNIGHFGLAADCYCHFTSPIRRYPDLLVHRALRELSVKGSLAPARISHLKQVLPEMGEHTSHRERRAMDAERDIIALKKCQFMEETVGQEFDGFVSGVQAFGIFVEIKDIFVEGLVHISSLSDDFYHFEEDRQRLIGENSRKIFQVGDGVRVTVAKVDLERREIDFTVTGLVPRPRQRPKDKPKEKPKEKAKEGQKKGRGGSRRRKKKT